MITDKCEICRGKGHTAEQHRTMIKEVEKKEKFNEWFDKNLVYCEDTHSFVHRCYDAFKDCNNYLDAQNKASKIIKDMKEEFKEYDE